MSKNDEITLVVSKEQYELLQLALSDAISEVSFFNNHRTASQYSELQKNINKQKVGQDAFLKFSIKTLRAN